jgi:hypothetical protein
VIVDLKRIELTAKKLRLELTAALRIAARGTGSKVKTGGRPPVVGSSCPPPK